MGNDICLTELYGRGPYGYASRTQRGMKHLYTLSADAGVSVFAGSLGKYKAEAVCDWRQFYASMTNCLAQLSPRDI